ncbi:MAG: hypothetical protein KA923_04160 [Opitutaceae bacterium]|nr:hypothetical protein [Opitutaceae bacterium]
MDLLLYLLLLVLVPLGLLLIIRRTWVGYLLAACVGSVILATRMIYLEQQASDREFDFIFIVSVGMWCLVLCLIYSVYAAVFSFVRRRRLKKSE